MPSPWSRLTRALRAYGGRLRAFRPNARWYLLSVITIGLSMGVFRLLFNFYALSVGLPLASLGTFVAATNLTALVLMLPLGFLADRIGSKPALLGRALFLGLGLMIMVSRPGWTAFLAGNAVVGVAQALARVVQAPFLMENSGRGERAYLFSFSSGLRMGAMFLGNTLGGFLPSWMAAWRGVAPTSGEAYGSALALTALIAWAGMVPVLFIRAPQRPFPSSSQGFAPWQTVRQHPRAIGRLLGPFALISLGAGLFIPFLNVFFRQTYDLSDPAVGQLFAWGSLAMGVGLIVAPPLADRWGKIQLVTLTQGLAVPFLALMGFAPWFPLSAGAYLVRLMLMNMSGPLYDAFLMEHTPPASRNAVAALKASLWSLGRLVSPPLSSWIQATWGFGPVFAMVMGLYGIAVVLYWRFFWREPAGPPGFGAPFGDPSGQNPVGPAPP